MKKTHHSRTSNELAGVTELGSNETHYSDDYDPSVLETFVNKHPQNDYLVTFDGYEFTSLCPKTGQPDFANVFISYIPTEKMVESKSLKLYLFSFRNHGDFHEDCMNIILDDLYKLMNPKYIEVLGLFTPRGGISIYPFVNRVNPAFETEELRNLAFQRKLHFLGNIQSYGRAIR
ncbi:preQ(1) synthase [Liquorilactobacillus uvarum]|uniref:preQ(1) synthase n=1 Tax=Liquorilactobacillus uvarum TaxID=303240 RepID=UPI0035D00694